MNAMNMPGFTAEAAIYKINECYQAAGNYAGQPGVGGILSQAKVIRIPTIEIKCYCGGYCSSDGTCRYQCYCL